MNSLSDRAGFLIIANLVKYSVGFLMPMVLVRLLPQHDYGTYQQLILISNTALGLMVMGLPMSIYYYYHQVDPCGQKVLLLQTSMLLGLSGLVSGLAIAIASVPLSASLNNPAMSSLVAAFSISVAFLIASEHSVHFMIAQNNFALAVGLEICETVVRALMLLLPIYFGYGLPGVVAGIVGYAILRFIFRSAFLFREGRVSLGTLRSQGFAFAQLAYSLPLATMSLVALIASTFNRGLVASSFTPSEFAIYTVGTIEIPLDVIFQASVANVLRASLPPLVNRGDLAGVVKTMREAMRKLSIIVLPSFVFLWGHAEQFIVVLFTQKYAESVAVFKICVWLVPLHMLVLSPIPPIFGKPKINLYIVLCMAVVYCFTSYALLQWIGFFGPVWAIIVANYFAVLVYLFVVIRLTKSSVFRLIPLHGILKVTVAALISLTASMAVELPALHAAGKLLLAALLFTAVFFFVAPLCRVFTQGDYELMKRWRYRTRTLLQRISR